VLAEMIAQQCPCDVYQIEAADPCPESCNMTVARNVEEQEADARPAIGHPLPSIDQYDTVLLGSPIWNVKAAMVMTTFAEAFDFTGKTVHPFTTYAMIGLGTTERDYAAFCQGATIGAGLVVRGEGPKMRRPPSGPGCDGSADDVGGAAPVAGVRRTGRQRDRVLRSTDPSVVRSRVEGRRRR
jgi:hypothetical protein